MKKIKNYIATDLAKKKIARYKYWSIKDETGITITSSEDTQEGRSFADLLDKIIADNVDAEVQVKFGTNEQSSRQNTPIFIRVNEAIEWVEPEEDETIKINGVPHKLDKNGNVNINVQAQQSETPTIEYPSDMMRQEMELQLEGLRKENDLKEQRFQMEMQNKLTEQTLKFKEMMLSERESRINEREQFLAQQEAVLDEKQQEMGDTIKGYAKHVPNVLGSLVKDWLKSNTGTSDKAALGKTDKPKAARKKVSFEFDGSQDTTDAIIDDEDIDLGSLEDFEESTDDNAITEPENTNTEDENI